MRTGIGYQGGTFRQHYGQTPNAKFKDYWFFVGYLEQRCRLVADILMP
jgi:hypothetical protein